MASPNPPIENPTKPSQSTSTARTYYNSPSADTFYHTIWGGQDIHIGLYTSSDDTIPLASQRTVERMASIASPITPTTRILDLGAGYGGAARWLAHKYGSHVTCLNLSEVQNGRNREKTREEGLEKLIDVVDGSFESLPFEDGTFDLIWSQDSFLHSSNRDAIVAGISRVLVEKGGCVVFTDPMAAAGADESRLVPIQKRLDIAGGLATKDFYLDAFEGKGLVDAGFESCTEQLVTHYSKVLEALEGVGAEGGIAEEYAENMKVGLQHWIRGGKEAQLEWGIFCFRR